MELKKEQYERIAKILGTTADALLDGSSVSEMHWQLVDQMFSEEHMYSKLKAFAQAEHLQETYHHAMGIRDDTVLAVALLHDVYEDYNILPEELPFSDVVKTAVGLLTKKERRFQEIGRTAALTEYWE